MLAYCDFFFLLSLSYLFNPSPATSKGMEDQYNCHLMQQRKVSLRSCTLFWSTCRGMAQTSAVVPGAWLIAQVLFRHLHSQLEADSHDGYGTVYGYHLPREKAWT
jgi:hypothetical protein